MEYQTLKKLHPNIQTNESILGKFYDWRQMYMIDNPQNKIEQVK